MYRRIFASVCESCCIVREKFWQKESKALSVGQKRLGFYFQLIVGHAAPEVVNMLQWYTVEPVWPECPHDLGLESTAKYNILLFLTFFEGNRGKLGMQVAALKFIRNNQTEEAVLQDMCLTLAFYCQLQRKAHYVPPSLQSIQPTITCQSLSQILCSSQLLHCFAEVRESLWLVAFYPPIFKTLTE